MILTTYLLVPKVRQKLPMTKFKRTLQSFLLDHCFYSIDEFLLFGAYSSSNHMLIYIYIYVSSIRIVRI
jgi:hypothetical protein